MIVISRCPYRISLLGGGSDLFWFLDTFEKGLCIGFSIPIFSRVVLGYRHDHSSYGILNYSSREKYSEVESICHPIIRNCLKILNIDKPIELASFGESISGSGLGSSSSFTVALLGGLAKLNNLKMSNKDLAKLAVEVEIDKMEKPIGLQDQYLCALGGVNILKFNKSRKVDVFKSEINSHIITHFMKDCFLVNTGINRSAAIVLEEIKSDKRNFDQIKEIYSIADAFLNLKNLNLEKGLIKLEEALTQSWELKKNMQGTMNKKLFEIENFLKTYNFKILKLLGAGGGGYFLVRYLGKSIIADTDKFTNKGLSLVKVEISEKGYESWFV